ncbi:hypothetical protein WDV93_26045 [Pantoea ananatis]
MTACVLTLQQRLTRFAENAPQLLHALTDRQWLFPLHPLAGGLSAPADLVSATVEKGLVTDLGEAGAPWPPPPHRVRCTARPAAT